LVLQQLSISCADIISIVLLTKDKDREQVERSCRHKGDDRKKLKALPENSPEDLSQYHTCRSRGIKFHSFGDMQRHILVEHMQKGDIQSDEESEK
jgi:hypothetical protein